VIVEAALTRHAFVSYAIILAVSIGIWLEPILWWVRRGS
jgi:hypothetical protein